MDLGLRDRVAIVTGGSSGIGLATVRAFLSEGAKVAFCARGEERLRQAHAQLSAEFGPASLLAQACDVLDAESVARFRDAVLARFGAVDCLVNNAGQGRMTNFASTTDEAWQVELQLKFFSVIRPTRLFLPALERSSAGSIVVVNSLLALQPEPYMVATAAARGGVQNLVRSLSVELAPKNVRVNSVLLGVIDSGQWQPRFEAQAPAGVGKEEWLVAEARKRHIPMGRFGRPEEPAAMIVFLCSPLVSYVTGAAIEIAGGAGRHI